MVNFARATERVLYLSCLIVLHLFDPELLVLGQLLLKPLFIHYNFILTVNQFLLSTSWYQTFIIFINSDFQHLIIQLYFFNIILTIVFWGALILLIQIVCLYDVAAEIHLRLLLDIRNSSFVAIFGWLEMIDIKHLKVEKRLVLWLIMGGMGALNKGALCILPSNFLHVLF